MVIGVPSSLTLKLQLGPFEGIYIHRQLKLKDPVSDDREESLCTCHASAFILHHTRSSSSAAEPREGAYYMCTFT